MWLRANLKLLSTALITLSLSSCATSSEPLATVKATYSRPSGVIAPKIEVVIIQHNDKIYFGLDEKNYLNLSDWLADLLRYTRSTNQVLKAYEGK